MEPMDRRTFLRNAGVLGLGAVAWACAKKTKTPASSSGAKALSVQLTAAPQFAVGDTRIAFALFQGENQDPVAPSDVTARVGPVNGKPVAVPVDRQRIERGSGGNQTAGTEVFEVYVVHHDFTAGYWIVDAKTGGTRAQAAFQVLPSVPEPKVGDHHINIEVTI